MTYRIEEIFEIDYITAIDKYTGEEIDCVVLPILAR